MTRWLLLGLVVAGCEGGAPPEPAPKPKPAPQASSAAPSASVQPKAVEVPSPVPPSRDREPVEPKVVEDRSEPVAWYAARGVPPLDRRWKSEDHAKAAAVLASIADREVQKLPRHVGASAPVFAKLTDMSALEDTTSEGVPRLLELSGYGEPLAALTRLYARRDAERAGFPAERARVTVASLDYVGLLARPLAGAPAPTDAKAREAFETALAGVRTGVTQTVTEALLVLEADDFRDEERRLIAGALRRAVEQAHALLPPSARKPLRIRLDLAASQSRDEATRRSLAAARDRLTSSDR